MNDKALKILVVGATGSIGRHVLDVAREQGHQVRALARDLARTRDFPAEIEVVEGDLTRPDTLIAAADGVSALVFTHGSTAASPAMEVVDYGGVRNVLEAIGSRRVRIALMTAIGITNRTSTYNLLTGGHDWKRRSERLVRASGHSYTIVRPGWFDFNQADQLRIVLLQGDKRSSGTPRDGVISRRQIAEILVHSLTSPTALGRTFELIAETGPAPEDFDALFATAIPDPEGALDGILDIENLPLADEPARVLVDIETVRDRAVRLGLGN